MHTQPQVSVWQLGLPGNSHIFVAISGLTQQKVEDSSSLRPPGASRFRDAPVDIHHFKNWWQDLFTALVSWPPSWKGVSKWLTLHTKTSDVKYTSCCSHISNYKPSPSFPSKGDEWLPLFLKNDCRNRNQQGLIPEPLWEVRVSDSRTKGRRKWKHIPLLVTLSWRQKPPTMEKWRDRDATWVYHRPRTQRERTVVTRSESKFSEICPEEPLSGRQSLICLKKIVPGGKTFWFHGLNFRKWNLRNHYKVANFSICQIRIFKKPSHHLRSSPVLEKNKQAIASE